MWLPELGTSPPRRPHGVGRSDMHYWYDYTPEIATCQGFRGPIPKDLTLGCPDRTRVCYNGDQGWR